MDGWDGLSLVCFALCFQYKGTVRYALRYPPHSPSLPLFLGDTTTLILVGRYRISFHSSFHPSQSIKHQDHHHHHHHQDHHHHQASILFKVSSPPLCRQAVRRARAERKREKKKTRKIELQARQRASERAGVYPPVCTYCNYLRQCSSRPIKIGQPAGLGGRRKVYSAFLPRPRPRLEAIAVDM